MKSYSTHEVTVKSQAIAVTPELVFDLFNAMNTMEAEMHELYSIGEVIYKKGLKNFFELREDCRGCYEIKSEHTLQVWTTIYSLVKTIYPDYTSHVVMEAKRDAEKVVLIPQAPVPAPFED